MYSLRICLKWAHNLLIWKKKTLAVEASGGSVLDFYVFVRLLLKLELASYWAVLPN
jgi:hypothetical protein